MKLNERITVIEVKLKYLEKLMYMVIAGVGANLGINFI